MSLTSENAFLENKTEVQNRLIALWALSEAGFGGMMHILKVPFSGIVVVGLSVFFVSLLAFFAEGSYRQILRGTIIVLLIKMAVSPHSPAPAYFAVWFQGIFGFLFFYLFKYNRISVLIYAIVALFESAFQKIIVLTIYFGMSIWNSINIFTDFVVKQFGYKGEVEMSNVLIGLYFFIYLIGAFVFAIMTIRVTKAITGDFNELENEFNSFQEAQKDIVKKKKLIGKRAWLGIMVLFILSIGLFINPSGGWEKAVKVFFRTILIILFWYILIAPFIKRIFEYFLKKKKRKFAVEVAKILDSFPILKSISWFAWNKYPPLKSVKNFERFLSTIIYLTLIFEENEKK